MVSITGNVCKSRIEVEAYDNEKKKEKISDGR